MPHARHAAHGAGSDQLGAAAVTSARNGDVNRPFNGAPASPLPPGVTGWKRPWSRHLGLPVNPCSRAQ